MSQYTQYEQIMQSKTTLSNAPHLTPKGSEHSPKFLVKSARGILFFWGLVIISLVLYGSLYRERTIVTAIKQNALATQKVIKGYENTLLRQQQRIERMDSVMLQTQQRLLQVYEEKTLLQQENKRIDSTRNQLDSAHHQLKKKVKTYEREITRLRNSYELPRVGEN